MRRMLTVLPAIILLISCTGNKKDSQAIVSADVTMLASPASDSCAEPCLFTDKNGLVYLSWVEKNGKKSILKYASFTNDKWGETAEIASGSNWFVNWADYPVLASDGNHHFIAHYLEKSDTAKFAYEYRLVTSDQAGKTWSGSGRLNNDSSKTEHGFVSMVPYQNGFFTAWLDGRKSVSENTNRDLGFSGVCDELIALAIRIKKVKRLVRCLN